MMQRRENLSRLESQMRGLIATMTASMENLEAELAELRKRQEALEALRHRIVSAQPAESDRLRLNVGGTRFETRQSERIAKNNFFLSLRGGSWVDRADPDGFFFVDREPTCISAVMDFLREGSVDLSCYTERELEKIKQDGIAFMVHELIQAIEHHHAARQEEGIVQCSFNMGRSFETFVPGIFFEIVVKKECRLHSISFVAGERRKVAGRAFYKEGDLNSSVQPRPIGEVAQHADKGQLIAIQFSAIRLSPGRHTIGVYSIYSLAVCPQGESLRDEHPYISLRSSYHTTDLKGNYQKRTGENVYDFCGEIAVSFRKD